MKKTRLALSTALSLILFCSSHWWAHAKEPRMIGVIYQNSKFEPALIKIASGERVKLMITNKDKVDDEFESFVLNRETRLPAGATTPIFIGPLNKGEYAFEGEFHPKTAQGKVLVE